ncbi:MAG: hypothetical protein GY757_12255, partial [bacterium]|nr:hypothetical protein [bacterium]
KYSTAGVKYSTAGAKYSTAGVKYSTEGAKYSTAGLKYSTVITGDSPEITILPPVRIMLRIAAHVLARY